MTNNTELTSTLLGASGVTPTYSQKTALEAESPVSQSAMIDTILSLFTVLGDTFVGKFLDEACDPVSLLKTSIEDLGTLKRMLDVEATVNGLCTLLPSLVNFPAFLHTWENHDGFDQSYVEDCLVRIATCIMMQAQMQYLKENLRQEDRRLLLKHDYSSDEYQVEVKTIYERVKNELSKNAETDAERLAKSNAGMIRLNKPKGSGRGINSMSKQQVAAASKKAREEAAAAAAKAKVEAAVESKSKEEELETRVDRTDGNRYTFKEFANHYGKDLALLRWDKAWRSSSKSETVKVTLATKSTAFQIQKKRREMEQQVAWIHTQITNATKCLEEYLFLRDTPEGKKKIVEDAEKVAYPNGSLSNKLRGYRKKLRNCSDDERPSIEAERSKLVAARDAAKTAAFDNLDSNIIEIQSDINDMQAEISDIEMQIRNTVCKLPKKDMDPVAEQVVDSPEQLAIQQVAVAAQSAEAIVNAESKGLPSETETNNGNGKDNGNSNNGKSKVKAKSKAGKGKGKGKGGKGKGGKRR